LRLLLANDGPEYDELSQLTRFCAVAIARGDVPPFRVALLAPGDRDQWYSASAAYSRVLAHDIVPALRSAFGVVGAVAGMGGAPAGAGAPSPPRRAAPRARGGRCPGGRAPFSPPATTPTSGASPATPGSCASCATRVGTGNMPYPYP